MQSLGQKDEKLSARMNNYELAFRMQAEVPDVIDLDQESEQTREMYGLNESETQAFGRQCLMARRLVGKWGSIRTDL